jgi:hypothetical protein
MRDPLDSTQSDHFSDHFPDHFHAVHFYADIAAMEAHVAKFIGNGLQAGESVLTIAIKERREGFARLLGRMSHEKGRKIEPLDHYTALDADEVLSTCLVRGWPEREDFFTTMDRVLTAAAQNGRPLRVYGEMVVRLWQRGNPEAALRLEELWNLLAQRHAFSLLCAYPMNLFHRENSQRFLDTCVLHHQISLMTA